MPHLIVECSENLAEAVSLDDLVRALHEAALATGVFPLAGIRTRVHVSRHYRIADGDPRHAFAHVEMRIARGRDLATRKRAAEQVFAALRDALAALYATTTLALSLELREIDPDTSLRHNNIHEHLQRQTAGGA
jgi:5-carboxymethyl-2-hydroxymuconate isomerase